MQKQYEELEKKQDFINSQIAKANSEIEFMITFESMKFLMTEDYNVITEKIESKKKEIKQTEENLRHKAEEEKQRELAELEVKKEREKEEALKNAQIKATQQQDKETQKTAVNSKYYDITLRFPKAPSQFLKDFKELVDSYGLEYIKIESKQI